MAKVKDEQRILKAARERQRVTYKRTFIGLSADFSGETLKARKEWHDTSEVLKGEKRKKLQPRTSYLVR